MKMLSPRGPIGAWRRQGAAPGWRSAHGDQPLSRTNCLP